jgi:hypothetical protein
MKRANRGFTLLEVMLVGVLTVSVLGMGLKLYISAQRMSAYSRLAQERIAVSRSLDKDLRAIMRQATGIASEAGGYRSAEDTLILELEPEAGMPRRAVISRVPEDRRPFIAVLESRDGVWQAVNFTPYTQPLSLLAFDTSNPALLQCRYQLALEPGERAREETPTQLVCAHPRGRAMEEKP